MASNNQGTLRVPSSSLVTRHSPLATFCCCSRARRRSSRRRRCPGCGGRHPPSKAVAGLDVAPGLEATLFASEPMMASPTNIDVDDRGRVWVCEVVNYRHRNGERPAGDRILILEDTDGDGRADKSTVFYQGRDIDSAMGICVLGNRVIVSVLAERFRLHRHRRRRQGGQEGAPLHQDRNAAARSFGPQVHLRAGRAAVLELRQPGEIGPRQKRQAGRRHFWTDGRRRRPSLSRRHGLSLRSRRQPLRGAGAQLPQQLRAGGRLVRRRVAIGQRRRRQPQRPHQLPARIRQLRLSR